MSDLDDVCNALVGMVSGYVYPNGTASPSVTGNGVRIYQGWPVPQQLDTDIAASICHVSVYPRPEEKNTTRYPKDWQPVSLNTPTIAVSVVGQQIQFAGNIPPANNPHNLMAAVNNLPYVYAVQPTDTMQSAVASLAALIAAAVPGTTSAGLTIQVPPSAIIQRALVGVQGVSASEIRRQERLFQIGIWADTPASRTLLAQAIDPQLANIEFFTMPDQFSARLIYKMSRMSDEFQKQAIYRRDLFYTVEYATTLAQPTTQITQVDVNLAGS